MAFIIILIFATSAIASAAAFFSVYGLASTFSGTFWSVVVMGASLELGKLVAASYLYRYWEKTNKVLKWYLISGIAALMILTSTGIFGYLSAGYQTDALPLKQVEEKVKVLEVEKERLIARKTQIDTQIAQLPQNSIKGRTQLIKGFKDEQATVTTRIGELDKELLELKTNVIEAEAHVGPIAYIATAFGLNSDNATKYLIYIIIFAFDPMAIALTLATNNVLRLRKEEEAEDDRREHEERMRKMQSEHEERLMVERFAKEELGEAGVPPAAVTPIVESEPDDPIIEEPNETPIPDIAYEESIAEDTAVEDPVQDEPVPEEVMDNSQLTLDFDAPLPEIVEELVVHNEPIVEELVVEDEPVVEEVTEPELNTKPPTLDLPPPQQRHYRPYAGLWNGDATDIDTKLNELVSHYNWLKQRRSIGEELSRDEMWELQAIEDVLKKHGYNIYL